MGRLWRELPDFRGISLISVRWLPEPRLLFLIKYVLMLASLCRAVPRGGGFCQSMFFAGIECMPLGREIRSFGQFWVLPPVFAIVWGWLAVWDFPGSGFRRMFRFSQLVLGRWLSVSVLPWSLGFCLPGRIAERGEVCFLLRLHGSFGCVALVWGVVLVVFPLREPCGVFRAFLGVPTAAELGGCIAFLGTPWAVSGRGVIGVDLMTLCHIFTKSRSPYRELLLKATAEISLVKIIILKITPRSRR